MKISLGRTVIITDSPENGLSAQKNRWLKLFLKPAIQIACIMILGILVYSNTFNSPFEFDDAVYVTDNPATRDPLLLLDSARVDALPGNLGTVKEQFRNRIGGHATFWMNYSMHGLNVIGYHLVNLLIHLMNALLVYLIVIQTFKTPFLKVRTAADPSFNAGTCEMTAFLCALLFVVHPVQTQAVTYISQRFTSLAAFFCLLSLTLYIKARLSEQSGSRYAYYSISLASAILAMKTKEISFTLPAIMTLYEFMFFGGSLKKRVARLSPFLLTMAIIPLTLLLSGPAGSLLSSISDVSRETASISRVDYLFTQFSVIATYIRLLFLPLDQNLDYDYPVHDSFFMPQVWLPLIFLLSIFILAIYLFYRSSRESPVSWGFRLISFGILYFFIALSVESSLIPIKEIIAEHRVYLPSFGFLLGFSAGVILIKNRLREPFNRAIIPVLLLVVVILAGTAYSRNAIWSDPLTLWADVARKSPMKARPHSNLGNAFFAKGDLDTAAAEYLTAINLDPEDDVAHYNLGIFYLHRDLPDEAADEFRTAIELNTDSDDAHLGLGLTLYSQKRFPEAQAEFLAAAEINPLNADAHSNLGYIYEQEGRIDDAIREYSAVIKLNPFSADTYYGLGLCLIKKNNTPGAIAEFERALKLDPGFFEARKALDELRSDTAPQQHK
jgi:protein O-mannosyl-transferase